MFYHFSTFFNAQQEPVTMGSDSSSDSSWLDVGDDASNEDEVVLVSRPLSPSFSVTTDEADLPDYSEPQLKAPPAPSPPAVEELYIERDQNHGREREQEGERATRECGDTTPPTPASPRTPPSLSTPEESPLPTGCESHWLAPLPPHEDIIVEPGVFHPLHLQVGDNVTLGPNVMVGPDVTVGSSVHWDRPEASADAEPGLSIPVARTTRSKQLGPVSCDSAETLSAVKLSTAEPAPSRQPPSRPASRSFEEDAVPQLARLSLYETASTSSTQQRASETTTQDFTISARQHDCSATDRPRLPAKDEILVTAEEPAEFDNLNAIIYPDNDNADDNSITRPSTSGSTPADFVIDCAQYPKIVNHIVSFLDADSRLALRATSRRWRAEMDGVFQQHLLVIPINPWGQMEAIAVTGKDRKPFFFKRVGNAPLTDREKCILNMAHTIDIDVNDGPNPLTDHMAEVVALLTGRINSLVLRLQGRSISALTADFGDVDTAVIFPPRVEASSPQMKRNIVPQRKRNNVKYELTGSGPVSEYAFPPNITSVVISIRYDKSNEPLPLLSESISLDHMKKITFVFTRAPPDCPVTEQTMPPDFLLNPIARLIVAHREAKIVLVGVTEMPVRWFSAYRLGPDSILSALRMAIFASVRLEYVRSASKVMVSAEELHRRIQFLTLDEYREQVGDETFALHSEPIGIARRVCAVGS